MKITTRCGEQAISEPNRALLAKAVEARVSKTNRVRADTTVIEANGAYPSDSGLLAKGVAKMAAKVARLKGHGLATRIRFADRTRSVRSRVRSINANLRRRSDDRLAEVKRINADLVGIAQRVAGQVDAVVRNARRHLRAQGDTASGRARSLVDTLEATAAATRKIAARTRQRLAGTTPEGSSRVVSLHDRDARPIVKGRLGQPLEFGYKAQIVDNEDGVIVDHNVELGNPPDAPMLESAIARVKELTGEHRVPSWPIVGTASNASRSPRSPTDLPANDTTDSKSPPPRRAHRPASTRRPPDIPPQHSDKPLLRGKWLSSRPRDQPSADACH